MSFKKFVKRLAPSIKKLEPKFVRKNEFLAKTSNASIFKRSITQNSSIAKAKDWGDTKAMRANLREQHELQTTPHSKTSEMIRNRDKLPPGDPERDRLTAQINASTLSRGKLGIAIGGTAVGGVAGGAITKAGGALTRENPTPGEATGNAVDTWPNPNAYPDPMQQMYAQNPNGSPWAVAREGGNPAGGGFLASLVNGLWSILVPKKNLSTGGQYGGINPGGMYNTQPVKNPGLVWETPRPGAARVALGGKVVKPGGYVGYDPAAKYGGINPGGMYSGGKFITNPSINNPNNFVTK